MLENKNYPREWYASSSCSASPLISKMVYDYVEPRSVIDFGCCNGIWLKDFKDLGVKEVLGIDAYIPKDLLLISKNEYIEHDLNTPIDIGRVFDLAVCLETAEHLKSESSCMLIEELCKAAPVVLFSAAVPNQGGTDHINEHWPEYWRDIFEKNGFVVVDCIRDKFWDKPSTVPPWYGQNCLFFVRRSDLSKYPKLVEEYKIPRGRLSRVWPTLTWLKLPDI